ncbi:hypothetical protein FRB95_013660 [Tulasnella sp. JGI-2019a]|nr:hypothetical protein FRB95_013660 [Tulasnella sp. JGI-2019a]
MATAKLGSLVIRTLSKPISNKIKQQAQEHPRFRKICIGLAQWTYMNEYRLRTGLLGESPKAIKPLSEAKAVSNGANTLAEGFLFAVAAGLIIAETWRSSRSGAKRRDAIDDQIEELQDQVKGLTEQVKNAQKTVEEQWEEVKTSQENVTRILDQIVRIGLRDAMAGLQDTPLHISTIARQGIDTPNSSSSPASPPLPLDPQSKDL